MSKEKLYFSHAWNEQYQAFLGVISYGHPNFGSERVVILDVEKKKKKREIKDWGKKQMKTWGSLNGQELEEYIRMNRRPV